MALSHVVDDGRRGGFVGRGRVVLGPKLELRLQAVDHALAAAGITDAQAPKPVGQEGVRVAASSHVKRSACGSLSVTLAGDRGDGGCEHRASAVATVTR